MADVIPLRITCEHGNPTRHGCPLCVLIDENTDLKLQIGLQRLNQETIASQASELRKQDRLHWHTRRALVAEIEALKRGEFICRSCGLRKDAEKVSHEF